MNKIYLTVLVSILTLLGCDTNKNPAAPSPYYDFSIYMLKDTELELQDIANTNIYRLALQDKPLISKDDIVMYDFSSHMIYLNKSKKEIFKDIIGDTPMFTNFSTKPFVVVCGNERIYTGALFSTASSIAHVGVSILDLDVFFLPDDMLQISNSTRYDDPIDPRNDERVQHALQNCGLYHAGLEIKLQNVTVVENADTSTISYQFKLTNNDSQTLLVPDPDKMGTDLFHYFATGLDFSNDETQQYFYASLKKSLYPGPYNTWDATWFTELKSGASLERSVVIKGFPQIPPGEYRCAFNYSGPQAITKEERSIQNTRYWIGNIAANTRNITIK